MHQLIVEKKEEIAVICRKYDVAKLEIYGSAARGTDFDPYTSDADFLVEYNPPLLPGLSKRYFGMIRDLRTILGRKVDLLTIGSVRKKYLLEAINRDRELVYAA